MSNRRRHTATSGPAVPAVDPDRINGWLCKVCQRWTVTVDVDHGVTPMFLACRAAEGCDGTAVSAMYQPPEDIGEPQWEWYRPTDKQARRMGPGMADHVARGGLAIRRRTSP